MKERQTSRLTRPIQRMPSFIRKALTENGILEAYRLRPPYQQNDYLGWIARAKLEPTRQRRLAQMLDELARGDRYMHMIYQPKRSPDSLLRKPGLAVQLKLKNKIGASKRGRRAR